MIIEDYTGSLEQRMVKLNEVLRNQTDLVLIGSSYGGLMAGMYALDNAEKVRKMILLAPALNLFEFKPYLRKQLHIPVMLYHGRQDDVVPPEAVHDIAQTVFLNLQYHLVEDDHPLNNTFKHMDWDNLIKF